MTDVIYTREQLKSIVKNLIKTNSKGRMDVDRSKISEELSTQIMLSTNKCRDKISERIFWILNDIYDYPKCIECRQ